MNPRAGLDALEGSKTSCSCQEEFFGLPDRRPSLRPTIIGWYIYGSLSIQNKLVHVKYVPE
jgi:hypothetical protein